MDDIFAVMKINDVVESENLYSLKRLNLEENEEQSPNKIIQKHEGNSDHFETNKKNNNILNINYIFKDREIFDSKNVLSNNKEDSPSVKLDRKNSANNKSKDVLNINKLKTDLIQNLENMHTPHKKTKNQKSNKKTLNNQKTGKYEKIISLYKPNIYFIQRKNTFILLFAFGILFAMVNLFLSIALTLYGNIEILSIFIVLNIALIFFYAIGIYFLEKNKIYTQKIISNLGSPEKIDNSYHKNNLHLLIYFLLFALNYYTIIMVMLSFYKNNIKLDIKSRAYDRVKWRFYFQNKPFNKVLEIYEKINIAVMVFGWSSVCLLITIFLFFVNYLGSYQFWKRIIQSICFLFGQVSFLLLNMSAYCFQFRNITLLDEFRLNWVILGLIIAASIGIFLSFIYFYIFYTENLKLVRIFNYLGLLLIIFSAVFTGGAKAFGLKFEDYKTATCNTLFKFISEDYLVKNKDCSKKYLFSESSLKDMECPKERIMINWEETETKIKYEKDIAQYPIYGCIDQYCCLKIYCKLKNGFNFQEILAFNQLFLYILLFLLNKYIKNRIGKYLEEEIMEKLNLLILIGFTLIIYVICFIIIISRPPTSSQNVLNDIEVKPMTQENSFINKNWVALSGQDSLIEESNRLWNELINNYYYEYNLDVIINNNNYFNFEYFEYNISSCYINIEKKTNNENIDEPLIDYQIYKDDNNYPEIKNFKTKKLVLNSLNKYFHFSQKYPFQPDNTINISCNIVYSTEISEKELNQISNLNLAFSNINIKYSADNKIPIYYELILRNYDNNTNTSTIKIFSNESFPLIDNENFLNNKINTISSFYIKGDVYNDTGLSLINIYNHFNNSKILIFNTKTNSKGEFYLGPFYIYLDTSLIYELDIEIYKLINNDILEYDVNYNNYTSTITIGGYGFQISNNTNYIYPSSLNNITLNPKIEKSYKISGNVYKVRDNTNLESVTVKLYQGHKNIEENSDEEDDNNLLNKAITNRNGAYSLTVNKNGQYTLVFLKNDYFVEKYEFIIDDDDKEIKRIGMIPLVNSGKIIVKMDWEDNPPDLDLICRFEPKKDNYCYTFFGNNKCVETNYVFDNRNGGFNGAEIIEVDILGEYKYFFYVRKYFDISNNIAKYEKKINNFENENNNISFYYKEYDELIQKSKVKLSLYANGIRTSAFILNIPYEEIIFDNNYYNYWGGFCLNGNNGLEGINIINKFYENEPPKNICDIDFF